MIIASPSVLFMGRDDLARPAMAAVLLQVRSGFQYTVDHAGYRIAPELHPLVREVMLEIGVPMQSRPRSMAEALRRASFTWAIALKAAGEDDAPRLFPGALHILRWEIPDPCADPTIASFRAVRDQLDAAVRGWIAEQQPHPGDPIERLRPGIAEDLPSTAMDGDRTPSDGSPVAVGAESTGTFPIHRPR